MIREMMVRSHAAVEVPMPKSLLVIDDEQMILDAIRIIFEDMGYEVVTTTVPADGIAAAVARPFDLILTDIRMPVSNGAEVTEAIRAARPDSRVLVITAFPNDPLVRRALDAGAFDIVRKPFEIAKILDFLKD
jgi:DNA-binding NtrC family response regulator